MTIQTIFKPQNVEFRFLPCCSDCDDFSFDLSRRGDNKQCVECVHYDKCERAYEYKETHDFNKFMDGGE